MDRSRNFRRLTVLLITLIVCCCQFNSSPPDKATLNTQPVSQGASGNWESLGYHKGDKAPDFLLYSNLGQPVHLYEELQKGKPVMIINASYTCDISRANIASVKAIGEKYKDKVETMIVYTIEAHPVDAASPYTRDSTVWIPNNNIRDSVEATQPRTYGDRIAMSKMWVEKYEIPFPVLVDGPDNEFWMTYGQAPNMCYIIDEKGVVEYRQTWYDEKTLEDALTHLSE